MSKSEPQPEETLTIWQALLKAQRMIGAAVKGSANPFFKSSYADLGSVMEACKGPLNECGITVLQPLGVDELGEYLETILLHESGEKIASKMRISPQQRMVTPNKKKDEEFPPYLAPDPQAQGSAISYARRYALQSFLFIPASDDDGESAMKRSGPDNGTGQRTTAIAPPMKKLADLDDDFLN